MAIECAQPAGNDLNYSLTDTGLQRQRRVLGGRRARHRRRHHRSAPRLHAARRPRQRGSSAAAPIALTAPDDTANLGPVLPDLDPPTADPGGGSRTPTPVSKASRSRSTGRRAATRTAVRPALRGTSATAAPTETGTSPSHIYVEEGTYHGTLTATNGAGLSPSTPFTVDVEDAPLIATRLQRSSPQPGDARPSPASSTPTRRPPTDRPGSERLHRDDRLG